MKKKTTNLLYSKEKSERYFFDEKKIQFFQIALEVGAQFVCRIRSKRSYTDEEKELIGAVALYLQDESERIRNNVRIIII